LILFLKSKNTQVPLYEKQGKFYHGLTPLFSFAYMPPVIDEIQEELKQEDLIRRFYTFLPVLVSVILAVLIGTGIYTWIQSSREKQLFRDEHAYAKAIGHLDRGAFPEAKRLLSHLEKNSEAFAFLARLKKAQIQLMDVLMTHSNASLSRLDQHLQELTQSYHMPSMGNFFTMAMGFLSIPGSPALQDKLSPFMTRANPWCFLWLTRNALVAYDKKEVPHIEAAFSLWNQESKKLNVDPWMVRYCTIGAGVSTVK